MSSINNLRIIEDRFGNDWVKGSNNNIHYNCPFCIQKRGKEDTDRKFYVSIDKLKYYCFKCHTKGRISNNVEVPNDSVYENVLNHYSESIEDDNDDNMFFVPNNNIKKGTLAYEYLAKRGITDEMINYYDIRFGLNELFGRIIVPNIVYNKIWTDMYSARSYINQSPKYRNPEGCKKTNSVFNLHRQHKGGVMYVVEGAITSICAGKDSVCIYGSSPSDEQLTSILDKESKEIYCCLDNDPAGLKGNEELADKLSRQVKNGTTVYIVYMPEGIDAADIGEEKFKKYVHENRIEHYSSVYTKIQSIFKK